MRLRQPGRADVVIERPSADPQQSGNFFHGAADGRGSLNRNQIDDN